MWNRSKKFLSLLFAAMFSLGVCSAASVVIVSDSTAVDYRNRPNPFSPGAAGWRPMSGWGEYAKDAALSDVEFFNRAMGGFSSKMYVERELNACRQFFRPGAWLLISFGSNDARFSGNGERNTDPRTTFPEYMKKITSAAEKNGARIVVITPMPFFQMKDGKFNCDTLAPFAEASRKFAADNNYDLIDLYQLLTEYFRDMPEVRIKSYYAFFEPGQFPNWPNGRQDPLHLSDEGSKLVWSLIHREIKRNISELAKLFQK